MYIKKSFKKITGETVVQLLVVVAILGLLARIIVPSFTKNRSVNALTGSVDDVVSTLVTARTKTLASYNGSQYGVRISNNSVTLFTGSSFNQSSSSNVSYALDSAVTIPSGTVSLNGGGTDVVFDRLTGGTSNYGTIVVQLSDGSISKTITITKTGLVSAN